MRIEFLKVAVWWGLGVFDFRINLKKPSLITRLDRVIHMVIALHLSFPYGLPRQARQ